MTSEGHSCRSGKIKLSVIVAFYDCQSSLKERLRNILLHSSSEMEVIVTGCCPTDTNVPEIGDFASVAFLEFPPNTSLPVLLGAAITYSSGEIIAITDSSCEVSENWVPAMMQAHHGKSAVVGGVVEISTDETGLVGWAAYFCDYARFMRPIKSGVARVVPGNNLSLGRSLLEKGGWRPNEEFWKSYWCRRLQSQGIELYTEPSAIVSWHRNPNAIQFLINRYHHGRCFAGMRIRESSPLKRLLFGVGSSLLPIIAFVRAISGVLKKGRFFGRLVLSVPLIAAASVLWSAGEMVGYFAGAGKSCQRIQ